MRRLLASLLPWLILGGHSWAGEPQLSFLAVEINGMPSIGVVPVIRDGSALLLPAEQFDQLRLRPPAMAPAEHYGLAYLPLDAVAGASYRIDGRRTTLAIDCAARCFRGAAFSAAEYSPRPPLPAGTGWFVNYDLLADLAEDGAWFSGLLDGNLYTPWGSGRLRLLGHDLPGRRGATRLDASWTVDAPAEGLRWRLGDSIAEPGPAGLPFPFAGIQLGTDFGLRPELVTFPLPELAAETSRPATLELYVDDLRRLTRSVEPGPFILSDLPVLTGYGEARLVITDPLGGEQIVTRSYYATPALLRPGLEDFAIQSGLLRADLGWHSDHYEEPFLAARYRLGLGAALTGALGAEASERRRSLALGGAIATPQLGLVDLAAALSDGPDGAGRSLGIGYEFLTRRWSAGLDLRWSSAAFTSLGRPLDRPPPTAEARFRVGFDLGRFGAVGASYARLHERDPPDLELITLSYAWSLGRLGALVASLFHSDQDHAGTGLGLAWTMPLGTGGTATTSFSLHDRAAVGSIRAQRHAPAAGGIGYRVALAQGATERLEAGLELRSAFGLHELEVARVDGVEGVRLATRGSIVATGSGVSLSGEVDDSFAIVETGRLAGVRVYLEHRLVGRTGADGWLVVPGLRAYEVNRVAVEPLDFPLGQALGETAAAVVPRRRTGVTLAFAPRQGRAALLLVRGPAGAPLPAGTRLRVDAGPLPLPVGSGGRAFVPAISRGSAVRAELPDGACRFVINRPIPPGPLPALGPFTCQAVP